MSSLRPKKLPVRWLLSIALAVAVAAFAIPQFAAHEGTNHGTIKVHDGAEADPPQRNEPHVSCDGFFVEGFNMAGDAGSLIFIDIGADGTGDEVVLEADWEGEPEGDGHGFHFLAGPFELEPGHYRVEAYLDEGHPGNRDHFSKSKNFWVECEGAETLPCPTDLQVTANEDGSVTIEFTPAPDSDGSIIYRALGDGDFEFLVFLEPEVDAFVDTTTEPNQAYTYMVTAVFGDRESQDCDQVEVMTIPDLGTPLAMALALVGGTVAYAAVRRRR